VLDGVSERAPQYTVRIADVNGTLTNVMFIKSVLVDGVVVVHALTSAHGGHTDHRRQHG